MDTCFDQHLEAVTYKPREQIDGLGQLKCDSQELIEIVLGVFSFSVQ